MKDMFKSKRFIAFAVCVALFIVMVYTTAFPILEIAAAITTITSVYIGAETFKPSEKCE